MDTAQAGTHREDHIPIDLSQPLVLAVHNRTGDVTVRAVDRTDVLVSHAASDLAGDFGDDGTRLNIDVRNNRIEVRPHPRAGAGWADIPSDIDFDTVVEQITKAFRRAGPRASARRGEVRAVSGHQPWADITIEVPRTITGQVEIRAVSGDVRIEDVTGEIALNAMSGDVRATRTSGDLRLQTASGDLFIEGASGRLTAHTASGDVHVTAARVEGFHIQTANGDILLDALLTSNGDFRVQTASGDVHLTLRRPAAAGEEPAATLAFHTVSGEARVTPPFRKTDRRLWQVGSGDRGPRVDVTSVSGDLSAGFAIADSTFAPPSSPASPTGDVPPAPPASPAPPIEPAPPSSPPEPSPLTVSRPGDEIDLPATSAGPATAQPAAHGDASRLAVLEAVERGEIDVEEALRRLEGEDSITST